jgi:hypothetical protein
MIKIVLLMLHSVFVRGPDSGPPKLLALLPNIGNFT